MSTKINLHRVVKFWGRKSLNLILEEFTNQSKVTIDPFCGSGTTGFASILKKSSAFLSDINPVAIFITSTLLSKTTLKKDYFNYFVQICKELEKEVYTISNYHINYAVWISILECPKCGHNFEVKKLENKVKCKKCSFTMPPRFFKLKEKLAELNCRSSRKTIKIKNKKILEKYISLEESLTLRFWYPKGTFNYPETSIEFRDGPHRQMQIKELFTKRNLYVASKIYNEIEKIWKNETEQGDILKLAFIASLANATKMIPHTDSSGPSWKLPRYWIPNIREERNFCQTFLRRLKKIMLFKEIFTKNLDDYQIFVSYIGSNVNHDNFKGKIVSIFKCDARIAYLMLPKADFIVLDPPHYDELNYYELSYLWQKWLQGKMNDKRFKDFNYWKNEISINNRIGKDLKYYNNALSEIVPFYVNLLKKQGKLILILHNKNRRLMEKTVRMIKEKLHGSLTIKTSRKQPKVPSSAQGIHKSKKFLYILRIYKH